jgi:hypothetical protein
MYIDYDMKSTLQRRHNRANANGLAPIQLRITISGVRCDLATGAFCPAAYWSADAKKVVFPLDKAQQVLPEFSALVVDQMNEDLAQFKRDVGEIYKRLRKPDPRGAAVPVTVAQVREQVRPIAHPTPLLLPKNPTQLLEVASLFMASLRAMPDEVRLTESTLKTYVSRYNCLERYLKLVDTSEILASEIDMPWCRRYERWLLTPEGNHDAAAMHKTVNFLQRTLSFAAAEGWLSEKKLHGYEFQVRAQLPPPVSLPANEVTMLVAVCRELHGPQRRAVVGWLFCCYTGLSWVDYRRFCEAPGDYLFTEPPAEPGQQPTYWIRMVRQKMKKRKPKGFSVPLFEPAATLLLAWRGCLPHTGDVNTNKLLHQVEEMLKLSESLTTKLARATFSQLRRDEGYSDEAVAAMMGDTITVMNSHYSRISERRISLETAQLASREAMRVAA